MSFLTEESAIAGADASVKPRILVERRIAVCLVEELLEQGFSISVFGSEDWTLKRSVNRDEILSAMSTTDDDQLRVRRVDGEKIGGYSTGWFHLVYGNDGPDVLSDYSTNMEPFMTKTNALIDKLG